jgi:protein-S-isoprenylcysteine O-methyltransferase Ste14
LLLLVAAGPHTVPGLPAWPASISWLSSGFGAALIIGGLLCVVAGATRLGANFTPLPYPKGNGRLIETGIFSLVRHPMYCGAIGWAVGSALWTQGLLTLGYAGLLFALLAVKASREERWLCARFPDYANYQTRVRKLIPFVY